MPADTAAVAWLSLDADDNDASRFWRYIAAAIGRAAPETDIDAGSDSEAAPAPSPDDALPLLIHALSSYARPIVLVLDDYHVIERREIHEGMTFLLDHLPACLHVVLSSRADPQVPLARLRARGDLVEVRAADLRFRGDEASAYLNDVMGLGLAPADVDALEGRTEGWIAALHLAALSLRGRGDVSRYVRQLAGSSRYITDYLVEEVLERQPEAVRAFLLDTAILDRLCADLCDAVTGRDDGLAMLRSLEEGNVFLVALDDERRWFRYHHLFADVLRARIARERAHVRELHARASQWFELDGERPDAIRHALAADDAARAARLIEPAVLEMLRTRNEATLRAWLEALPDEVIEMRPVLSAGYAGMLLHSGTFATVEARLDAAERHLATATREVERTESDAAAPVFVDEEQFRTLAGMIALYRAGHAHVMGNGERTIAQARQALASMADDDPLRGGALALLGLALWSEGDLETASERYAEGIALVHAGGFVHDSSTIMLADMLVARGRLRDASRLYGTAIGRADALGGLAPRGSADLHIGASEICREQDDLDAALEHLAASREGGDAAGLPENRYRWFTAMAGISLARQDFEGAIVLLDDAARLYSGGFSPDVRPIAAQVARTQILQEGSTMRSRGRPHGR